ncbi:MAG: hypothetical protein PHI41_01315 [Erysipelotrichaceae bacterium]|nr:hypothetical protein [Erysipelotrichaceae bacterium]
MFKSFINLFKEEEDPTPDLIVEKRRQEKVTSKVQPVSVEPQQKAKTLVPEDLVVDKPEKAGANKKADFDLKNQFTKEDKPKVEEYKMTQVISPIYGKCNGSQSDDHKDEVKKKKIKAPKEDGLINVFSPFYVPVEEEEPEPKAEPKDIIPDLSKKVDQIKVASEAMAQPEPVEIKDESVEDNIRNIAKMIDDTDADLKIIEERTGEFRLDFKESKKDAPSVTEEIKDDTSLEELMNLYDKFKN